MNSRSKVRLSIDCSPKERKCIKILAAREDKTISEYLLSLARDRISLLTSEGDNQRSDNQEDRPMRLLDEYYKVLGY